MSESKNMFEKIVWISYVFFLFSIVAFGDRENYYMISNIAFLIMIGLMSIRIFSKHKFLLSIYFLSFVPFMIYSFISLLWTASVVDTTTRSITMISLIILMLIVSIYLYITNEYMNFFYGFAIAGVLILLYVTSFYGINGLKEMLNENVRVGTDIVNANTLAIFMAISSIIFLILFFRKKKIIFLLPIIGFVIIIALTGSKKGIMDLIIGVVLFSIIQRNESKVFKRKNFTRSILIILVLILMVYICWHLPIFSTIRIRIEEMFLFLSGESSIIDYSTYERQLMIEAGVKQFFETPLLGNGIGASGIITNYALGYNTYLHNNFIELLATGGVIGFLLYYLPILKMVSNCWKYRKNSLECQISFIMIVIILVNDLASVQYFSKITFLIFSIVASSMLNNKNKKRYIK